MNSRSEYNRCSLPRLTTQLGESEYKKYSDELAEEKKQDEILEAKIRELRKLRNKARLAPQKREQQNTKRRKINENNEYVTLQEIWGHPEITKPVTRTAEIQEQEQEPVSQKVKTVENPMTPTQNIHEIGGQIKLNNLRTINKIFEGPKTDVELEEVRDWDKVLTEHRERIELEEQNKNKQLRKQKRKVDGWQLYNLCKNYLEENNVHWKKRKVQVIEEQQRLERLEIARTKIKLTRKKQKEVMWNEKIQLGLDKVSEDFLRQDETEETLRTRQELKNAKSSLWKLRTKENKLKETDEVKEIKLMDKKIEHVTKLLEKEKLRLLDKDKNVRKTIRNNENKMKKQNILTEVWATYRWITEYLIDTTEAWEKEKSEREQEYNSRILEWKSMTRAEKIQTIIAENKKDTTSQVRTDWSQEITQEILENVISKAENKIIVNEILRSILTEAENKITARSVRRIIIKQPVLSTIREQERTSTPSQIKISQFFKPSKETTISPLKTTVGGHSSQVVGENNTPKNTPTKKIPPKTSKLKQETNKNDKTKKNVTTPKNKRKINEKQQREQKSVQQLRGFWTAFAKKQKEKSEMSRNTKETYKKLSDKNTADFPILNLEASPNQTNTIGPGSGILEPSISEKKSCAPVQLKINLKSESSNQLLELPKLD